MGRVQGQIASGVVSPQVENVGGPMRPRTDPKKNSEARRIGGGMAPIEPPKQINDYMDDSDLGVRKWDSMRWAGKKSHLSQARVVALEGLV
ncbi:hypothetical protein PM082_015151 [Marasmius tenuissimus]|nr:hypothetical protein PM082_015151 [Marasmius tenuissimus]